MAPLWPGSIVRADSCRPRAWSRSPRPRAALPAVTCTSATSGARVRAVAAASAARSCWRSPRARLCEAHVRAPEVGGELAGFQRRRHRVGCLSHAHQGGADQPIRPVVGRIERARPGRLPRRPQPSCRRRGGPGTAGTSRGWSLVRMRAPMASRLGRIAVAAEIDHRAGSAQVCGLPVSHPGRREMSAPSQHLPFLQVEARSS